MPMLARLIMAIMVAFLESHLLPWWTGCLTRLALLLAFVPSAVRIQTATRLRTEGR